MDPRTRSSFCSLRSIELHHYRHQNARLRGYISSRIVANNTHRSVLQPSPGACCCWLTSTRAAASTETEQRLSAESDESRSSIHCWTNTLMDIRYIPRGGRCVLLEPTSPRRWSQDFDSDGWVGAAAGGAGVVMMWHKKHRSGNQMELT